MIANCHQLTLDGYLEALSRDVELLATAIRGSDFSMRVPTCPDWNLAELVRHLGGVHRWAANHVRVLSPVRIPSTEMDFEFPDDPAGLPDWLLAGRDDVVATFQKAEQDAPMWGWGADKHARFWPRRQVHETAVHRADAEIALGIDPVIPDSVAIDGLDEYLDNLPHAEYFAPNVAKLVGTGETISLRAGNVAWRITLEPDGFSWSHDDGDADAVVAASPTDLDLFMWGRRVHAVETSGDESLLARWVENSSL